MMLNISAFDESDVINSDSLEWVMNYKGLMELAISLTQLAQKIEIASDLLGKNPDNYLVVIDVFAEEKYHISVLNNEHVKSIVAAYINRVYCNEPKMHRVDLSNNSSQRN